MTDTPDPTTLELTAAVDGTGERADKLLARCWTTLSRARLQALIAEGRLTLNDGTLTDPAYRVKPGDRFTLQLPPPIPAAPRPQAIPLTILFEDAHLLVVDKPAGLVVHPAAGNPDGTLVNALLAHCGAGLSGIGGVSRPGIVHRLDKDTSGLMVVAKTDTAHQALSRQFAENKAGLERTYLALVWGVPAPPSGTIDAPIGRSPTNRKKMTVRSGGKPAVTHYRLLRTDADATTSLVACRLDTGRTHQIRVHMAHIGYSIVGDPLYGRIGKLSSRDPDIVKALRGFSRQALHAATLGFEHPVRGEFMTFESNLPNDFNELLDIVNIK